MICLEKENPVQLESRIKYKDVLAKEIKRQNHRHYEKFLNLWKAADPGIAEGEGALGLEAACGKRAIN